MEYYSAIEKWKLAVYDNMDGTSGDYEKWNSQTTNIICHLYGESKQQNKWIKKKKNHWYREWNSGCQKGGHKICEEGQTVLQL